MQFQFKAIYCANLLLIFLVQPSIILAQDVAAAARANRAEKVDAAKKENAWSSPTRVTMRAQEQNEKSTLVYEFSGNQDLHIVIETASKGKTQTGEIMLINGRRQWLLAKGVPMEKGYEIDALDEPVLNLKLVLELLSAAAPGGPNQVKEKTTFNVKEQTHSIAVSTPSASGGLEAPWSLRATIEPAGPDQFSFDLSAKATETVNLTWTWQKQAVAIELSDDVELDGWQIFSIGPIKETNTHGTILDYGARPLRKHPKTLGELRKTEADPGQ